jgi:hypothetical protein
MAYEPQPLDTSDIQLSPELLQLTEQLASNTHEVWARQRVKDGWTWGKARDDAARHHPGLVPYDELDESEKQYDRIAALETLKLIQAIGYKVAPANGESSAKGCAAALLLQKIQQAETVKNPGVLQRRVARMELRPRSLSASGQAVHQTGRCVAGR